MESTLWRALANAPPWYEQNEKGLFHKGLMWQGWTLIEIESSFGNVDRLISYTLKIYADSHAANNKTQIPGHGLV